MMVLNGLVRNIRLGVNMKVDIEVVRGILKQLKRVSLSDLSYYLKTSSKELKTQMPKLKNYFQVEMVKNRTYIGLK